MITAGVRSPLAHTMMAMPGLLEPEGKKRPSFLRESNMAYYSRAGEDAIGVRKTRFFLEIRMVF